MIGPTRSEPHQRMRISRSGVLLDGQPLLATDDGIEVEQVADDLHIVRLALLVERVEADQELPSSAVTTYSPLPPP